MKKHLAVWMIAVVLMPAAIAAGPQWVWETGKMTSNGAITVKSVSGATTYSATQNPTGAVAKTNQSAVTQPPTVIVQATASLPIGNENDPCTPVTSGSAPQMADEGLFITADRRLILSCQSGLLTARRNATRIVDDGGCSTTEVLVGGGAYCTDSGWPKYSFPNATTNSWNADCYNGLTTFYSVCLAK